MSILAISSCRYPVISAVGHETDFTICDFVADLRAPTPSAAAELSVPDIREQKYYVASIKNSLFKYFENYINDLGYELDKLVNSPILQKPELFVDNCYDYINSLNEKLNDSFKNNLTECSSEFAILCSKLDALSPLKVLGRGYSIAKKDGVVIKNSDSLLSGDKISIQFADGSVDAEVI